MKKTLLLWLTGFLSFAPAYLVQSGGSSKPSKPERPHVPGQLLVAFESDEVAAKRTELFAKYHAQELEKVGSSQLYLIQLPEGADLKSVQDAIRKEPGVRYAEPNGIMKTFGI